MQNPSTAVISRPHHSISPIKELHVMPLKHDVPLVLPVSGTEEIVEAWNSFTELKLKLLNATDFVLVKGENFAKKSAFRKLALAFGISVEITREDRIDFKSSTAFLMTAKATSPNGRFMTAVGSCHTDEKKFSKPSDARAVAQTRATNRAIADLIGWSAPSAEEMIGEEAETTAQAAPALPATHPHAISSHAGTPHITAPYVSTVDSAGIKSIPPVPSLPDETHIPMTERQKKLILELLSQRFSDPEEREEEISQIEGFSKQDASSYISSLLRHERQN